MAVKVVVVEEEGEERRENKLMSAVWYSSSSSFSLFIDAIYLCRVYVSSPQQVLGFVGVDEFSKLI